MSVINYQSFQDLDQIDSYYLHSTTNNTMNMNGLPQTQIWCTSQTSSHPLASVSQSGLNTNNNFQQQTYHQQHFDNANIAFHEMPFNKNSESECTDLLSRELPHTSVEQPVAPVNKVNAKQSSIQELIASKEDQFFHSNQDSGNDIQNAQTRSNSFQSENQICSTSTIKVTNKMTTSTTYPTIQDMKQNLESNRHSSHEIVSPHPAMKQSPYNPDLHYQPTSASSCSSASLCCPTVSNTRQMNGEIRGDFRSDDIFHSQPAYYSQSNTHQASNGQIPYQTESEYYHYSMGYGQTSSGDTYQIPQKKCPLSNNQNSFQMAQVEERGQQHPMKIYSQGSDKSQISNFARYYEQDYQNASNFKGTGSTSGQYSSSNNHYYYERDSENIIGSANSSVPPADFHGHRYPVNSHNMHPQQNPFGTGYYSGTHASHSVPFTSYKSEGKINNELQTAPLPAYQNSHYNQNHYYDSNYPYAPKYHSNHYDPDTFFDYECAAEFENGSHQNENNFPHFANEQQQQQHYGTNSYGSNLIANNTKFVANQSYEMSQKTYSSNSAVFYNALNNASLAVPTSVINVTKIDQDGRNNFQPEFIRLSNQQIIEDSQGMPALLPSQNMNQQYRRATIDSGSSAITQQQGSDAQSPSETISRHRESIDTIVPTSYNQDLCLNKEQLPINLKNAKEEIILEDSQDECSSPGSAKHIAVESARARAKTINIVRSPAPKKSASSVSLKLTPKNSPTPKIFKRSLDITTVGQEEDEEEKELRLKLEQVKIEKKFSIDTCSLDDDEEEDDEECGDNDSQDNNSINSQLLMLTQNKKNVVKNIMSAFKTFVLTWGCKKAIEQIYNSANDSCEEIDDIQRKFKRYIGSKSFNHYSLRLLILHINYGPIFKFFLQKYSGEWLENSKIKDTESHQKMIMFFLSCFDDIKIIDTLRRHPKKKCRFS